MPPLRPRLGPHTSLYVCQTGHPAAGSKCPRSREAWTPVVIYRTPLHLFTNINTYTVNIHMWGDRVKICFTWFILGYILVKILLANTMLSFFHGIKGMFDSRAKCFPILEFLGYTPSTVSPHPSVTQFSPGIYMSLVTQAGLTPLVSWMTPSTSIKAISLAYVFEW